MKASRRRGEQGANASANSAGARDLVVAPLEETCRFAMFPACASCGRYARHAAYAMLVRERPDALFVAADVFFSSRRFQLISLAARHALPAVYSSREIVEGGGLMSYGTNIIEMYREVGAYSGRILKGEKPA